MGSGSGSGFLFLIRYPSPLASLLDLHPGFPQISTTRSFHHAFWQSLSTRANKKPSVSWTCECVNVTSAGGLAGFGCFKRLGWIWSLWAAQLLLWAAQLDLVALGGLAGFGSFGRPRSIYILLVFLERVFSRELSAPSPFLRWSSPGARLSWCFPFPSLPQRDVSRRWCHEAPR